MKTMTLPASANPARLARRLQHTLNAFAIFGHGEKELFCGNIEFVRQKDRSWRLEIDIRPASRRPFTGIIAITVDGKTCEIYPAVDWSDIAHAN